MVTHFFVIRQRRIVLHWRIMMVTKFELPLKVLNVFNALYIYNETSLYSKERDKSDASWNLFSFSRTSVWHNMVLVYLCVYIQMIQLLLLYTLFYNIGPILAIYIYLSRAKDRFSLQPRVVRITNMRGIFFFLSLLIVSAFFELEFLAHMPSLTIREKQWSFSYTCHGVKKKKLFIFSNVKCFRLRITICHDQNVKIALHFFWDTCGL